MMYAIQLDFECMKTITQIMFYSGVQWYACISNSIKQFIKTNEYNFLSENSIRVLPVNNGVYQYRIGEIASIVIFFEEDSKELIFNWIRNISFEPVLNNRDTKSQFSINGSLSFIKATNLQDKMSFNISSPAISEDSYFNEIDSVIDKNELMISFISPLRLKRPDSFKKAGHKFFDEDYFDILVFIAYLEKQFNEKIAEDYSITITYKSLTWIDMIYKNSIGGVMGSIIISGTFPRSLISLIVKGQYVGLGKNQSFGFGQYRIKESIETRSIDTINKTTLYHSLMNRQYLNNILENMDKEAVDFDGITLQDVLDEKALFINTIIHKMKEHSYFPSESQTFQKRKKNGKYRTITVNNFTDRFVFKTIAKILSDSCDNIFSENSYAYRVGYGHHKAVNQYLKFKNGGYHYGVKADIESFFDSIPLMPIYLLLEGLFRNDPILRILEKIFDKNKIGLDQGNALSPLLSNLYMISFDTQLKNSSYKMIRYADDFIVLSKVKDDSIVNFIETALKNINLKMSIEKSISIEPDTTFEFLGHLVEKNKASKIGSTDNTDIAWTYMFDKKKIEGIPIYISYYNSYVRNEKENLIIETDNENRKIPWKLIQRIVIIGKPRVSASVIQKALEYNKPIQFLNILGNAIGGFNHHLKWINIPELLERRGQNCADFTIQFIKSVVKAKLHNQRHILKKNGIKSDLLRELMISLKTVGDIDSIRGKEGAGSAEFFKHYKLLVDPFPFNGREYYPPVGPVNAMLSLGYTLIYNRISESLISYGFYPYEGLYHNGRGNHKALASDLMEPFRFISERIVLHLIHTNSIKLEDFSDIQTNNGNCTRLQGDGFRKFINRFEWMMNQQINVKGKNMNFYSVLDDSVKTLYKSIVLGIQYNPFFLN